jgi:hypothetical protein
MTTPIGKFIRKAKVGKRARESIAKQLGFSDKEVLKYLKRRHLWEGIFYPGDKTEDCLNLAIRLENYTNRPQVSNQTKCEGV